MPETYTFELTFTGLCIFTFTGPKKREPDRVDVLLVDATGHSGSHRHLPYLSFDSENLEPGVVGGYELAPGPDGRQLGFKGLQGAWPLEIEIRKSALPPLEAVWRPVDVAELPPCPKLGDRSQEDWLDWVMALRRMNPETRAPQANPPFNGLRSEKKGNEPTMAAWVKLTGGVLKARGFPMRWDRDDERWQHLRWTFKEPAAGAGGGKPSTTHAMAGSVVLSIPGIPAPSAVVLKHAKKFEVSLKPHRLMDGRYQSLVQASVTNLPDSDDGSGHLPEYLDHFTHFYEPVEFEGKPPAKLRLPHLDDYSVTRPSSYCPPTTHTEGS